MGTRCNVVVKFGASKVYLYRHWDGYPAECGAALVEAIQAAMKWNPTRGAGPKFVAKLLELRHEKASYEPEAKPVYELTEELHGDIEHVYEVAFAGRKVNVRHAERPRDYPELAAWAHDGYWYDLVGFVGLVNSDRAESNRRIRKLKAGNPGNPHYADMGEYEMIGEAA